MAYSIKPTVWIEPKPPKPGPYRVRAEVDGRRLPDIACGTNARHAKEKRAEVEAALWKRRLGIVDGRKTVGAFLEEYLADRAMLVRKREITPRTHALDARAIAVFHQLMGDPPLAAVDRALIQDYERRLSAATWTRKPGGRARPYHQNAIRHLLKPLRTAFRKAYHDEQLVRDPFAGFKMPPELEVANPPTEEQVGRLWDELPMIGRRAMTLYALCGLRRSELHSLERPGCLIPPAPALPGAAPGSWILRVRKAKTRRAKVEYKEMALQPAALAAIQEAPETGKVIPTGPRRLQFLLQRARQRAGLGRIRWHDLRHLWATLLMSRNKDEYALMQVGGWASRAAVARYQHRTDERRDVTLQLPPVLPQDTKGRGTARGDSPSETSP